MLLNELLNIKYPIIGGAMANISNGEFAACVSNGGGLGIIATAVMTKEDVKNEILKCRSLTDKPFGVNLMLMNPNTKDIVDLICEMKVAVVTTGAGNPGVYIEQLKNSGIKVFPIVPNCTLAKRLERYNIDGFIAEGTESGGHVGETTTISLVTALVNQTKLPVVAAGGIASGKGLLAMLSLGAVGVQIGTVLLTSNECQIHENYKNSVINARDSDTVVTGRSLGAPVRIMKNKMSKTYVELEKTVKDAMELEHLTLGAFKKAINGDVENGSVMMGQIASICTTILPVSEILEKIVNEAKEEQSVLLEKVSRL